MELEQIIQNMYKFMSSICIEGGCGYDLKQISFEILNGNIDYDQAIRKWQYQGHYLL